MAESLFDQFARNLARPMSRRRAVRVMGATLAAAAVPALRPNMALGQDQACDYSREYDCFRSPTGEGPQTYPHWCCPFGSDCGNDQGQCNPRPCPPGQTRCDIECCQEGYQCVRPAGERAFCQAPCKRPCGEACCSEGEECVNGRCVRACSRGRVRCSGRCCDRGDRCVDGRCVKRCDEGRAPCGDRCCPRGQRCDRGRCVECSSGRRACGKKCCAKGQDCCTDEGGRFVCCDTRKRDCCSAGKPGSTKMTCCPPRTTCAAEYDLDASGGTAGINRKTARTVCCPKARRVPDRGCCPPGHRSLGGRLVVVAGGGGGECCREDKICGSGSSMTCCAHAPGYEEDCVSGRCVRRTS